ncbi:hypothetical protein E8E13_007192 [Curvularia kusanoi]|uniref:Velvet domain-containing protein n=1 Tax=Curvularia kusanoi TaxID=90978 RepID=A0A9P4TI01_CURKU|nr:hypothetical protein E8E13_007192 [Curvularia kusanoi]
MYSHSRQSNQYPIPAPPPQQQQPQQQQRPGAGPLPPPPQLHESAPQMMHLPAPGQQQHHQPAPPPQQMQPPIMYRDAPPDPNGDYVGQHGGKTYRLKVEQQPIRARMCGFGDKDRRPITPPPCIRLILCDAVTGQEIDANEIDTTFNTLVVDLWHEDISRGACNLVRHSNAAPTVSISSSVTTSFPPPPDRPMFMQPPMQYNAYGQPMAAPTPYGQPPFYGGQAHGYPPPYGTSYGQPAAPTQNSNSNHTRNLIGQASVSSATLNDAEGTFRLKFMIFNVASGDDPSNILGHGEKTPMLASCFSDPFTVYSAKKFPGVIESTTLSKCFAQQGIKIPIRKDGPRTLSNQNEYEDD